MMKILSKKKSQKSESLPKHKTEFEIEGELTISWTGPAPAFLIDDCYLSEFIQRHFKVKSKDAIANFGKVKIIIIPINE